VLHRKSPWLGSYTLPPELTPRQHIAAGTAGEPDQRRQGAEERGREIVAIVVLRRQGIGQYHGEEHGNACRRPIEHVAETGDYSWNPERGFNSQIAGLRWIT
jgi:hypothetical protein